ncbi:hypothetical protein DO97_10445 [Neosynechococcus sphagnicola sy1]|uniref:DUF7734 domain-containing protein n=1 Tax=Neosynechococcus sphagnicola sy1 TaxID=1497020 RepID=A0A098TNE3_9CYAN|nr:hypothetical protein [Neosynechococcus sphagnicola]KGF73814.1 hypothetical protein DO97_10445 [Neosynechococcus sphagnicola sy1]
MLPSIGKRLEHYTTQNPEEVLLVSLSVRGNLDQVVIFRGYSSSLTRPTAFDPDVPVLPLEAEILKIDRLQSPYDPQAPRYLQQGLIWEEMELLLQGLI